MDAGAKDSAASNTIVAVHDTQGPTPEFTPLGGSQSTTENKTLVQLDFGERVLGANPSKLFTMTYSPADKGFSRVDLLYDVNNGLIFIIGQIRDPNASTLITFTVVAGSTTDIVGNPTAGTTFQLSYSPVNEASAAVGEFMSTSFAYSASAMMVGSAFGVIPPTAVAQQTSQAQQTYLVGTIPMAGMPASYSGLASAFSFMSMDFP